MQVAQLISLDIQTGVLPLDMGVIAAEVTKQTTATIRDGADKADVRIYPLLADCLIG